MVSVRCARRGEVIRMLFCLWFPLKQWCFVRGAVLTPCWLAVAIRIEAVQTELPHWVGVVEMMSLRVHGRRLSCRRIWLGDYDLKICRLNRVDVLKLRSAHKMVWRDGGGYMEVLYDDVVDAVAGRGGWPVQRPRNWKAA